MPPDDFDYAAARARLHDRRQANAATNRALWERARRDADAIIAMIIRDYRPTRLYQWGSVLHAERFHAGSDIDIAVEGVDSVRMLGLLADAEKLTDFPLDIVQLETVLAPFRRTILRKAVCVHEA